MTERTVATGGDPRLGRATLGLIAGLLVQFLLGMFVNLFVTIPDDHPGARPTEYFGGAVQSVQWATTAGPPALALHAFVGIVLFVGALGLVVRVRRLLQRFLTTWATLGLLMIVAAGFNGASFLNYNEDFSSMLMAVFFALAVLSYGLILYRLGAEAMRAAGNHQGSSGPAAFDDSEIAVR
ncbi:MAG: hypothetical protein ACRDGI_06525 [Candidatus Limnocylindrales bacterium]